MSNELLQEAVNALQIKNISLLKSNCELADQFLPRYDSVAETLQAQFKHLVTGTEQITFSDDDDKKIHILRFHVEFGVRLISPDTNEREENTVDQKALIETTFVAEYELKQDSLSGEAVREFALKNVSFQVWPYWREYLSNTCERMNLPRITLPLMQKTQNCPE